MPLTCAIYEAPLSVFQCAHPTIHFQFAGQGNDAGGAFVYVDPISFWLCTNGASTVMLCFETVLRTLVENVYAPTGLYASFL